METPSAPATLKKEAVGDKASFKLKIPAGSAPAQRPTRYKEKFQALRDKYNEVTALNAEHHRSLEIAEDKMRRLQAENDLLLDAIHSHSPQLLALVSPPIQHPEPPLPPPHHIVPSQSRRHRDRELREDMAPQPQPIPHRRGGHREEHDQAFEWPHTHRRDSPPPGSIPQHSPPEPRWMGNPRMDRTPDVHMSSSAAHSPVEPIPFHPPTNGRSGRRPRRASMAADPTQNGHDRFIEENIPRDH